MRRVRRVGPVTVAVRGSIVRSGLLFAGERPEPGGQDDRTQDRGGEEHNGSAGERGGEPRADSVGKHG